MKKVVLSYFAFWSSIYLLTNPFICFSSLSHVLTVLVLSIGCVLIALIYSTWSNRLFFFYFCRLSLMVLNVDFFMLVTQEMAHSLVSFIVLYYFKLFLNTWNSVGAWCFFYQDAYGDNNYFLFLKLLSYIEKFTVWKDSQVQPLASHKQGTQVTGGGLRCVTRAHFVSSHVAQSSWGQCPGFTQCVSRELCLSKQEICITFELFPDM